MCNQSANWPVALIIGRQRSISLCSVLRSASGVAFSGVGSVVISAKRLIKAGSFSASAKCFREHLHDGIRRFGWHVKTVPDADLEVGKASFGGRRDIRH